jgi:ESS family glutamate:Na+ symporter
MGWVKASEGDEASGAELASLGRARISSESIDPLLLQVVWLTLAFGIGLLLQWLVTSSAGAIDQGLLSAEAEDAASRQLSMRLTVSNVVDFPLFIYTLFGGWLVRKILEMIGRRDWIDGQTINRLTGMAMDVLVVAAIASLNLAVVANLAVPFCVLFVAGAIWAAICLLLLSRWILPKDYWFQLGLINYGMSTGTTATGFVLLRMVDAKLESGAAEDYALAAPMSAPFIGGGVLTVALPLLVLERVSIAIPAIVISAVVLGLVIVGVLIRRQD